MKSLCTFIKKEFLQHQRSGTFLLFGILFCLFGIMNPAVAKLTPWLLEMFSESMSESGIQIASVTVSAMDSWVQFYKNIPMALIVFVLLESSSFTREYTSGTLVLSLTKGLARNTVVISKAAILVLLWTACYWLCFAITYGYNAWFWDNSVAQELAFSSVCWWVFGMMTVGLMVPFSVVFSSYVGVLLGTGGVIFASYLAGLLPKIGKYLPTRLTDGNSLIYGLETAESYLPALAVALVITVASFAASFPIFRKKQL